MVSFFISNTNVFDGVQSFWNRERCTIEFDRVWACRGWYIIVYHNSSIYTLEARGFAKSWPREAEAAVIELKTRFFFENKPKMTETSTEDVFLPSKAKLESQPQALAERAERTELRPRAAATLQRELVHLSTTRGRCTGQISRLWYLEFQIMIFKIWKFVRQLSPNLSKKKLANVRPFSSSIFWFKIRIKIKHECRFWSSWSFSFLSSYQNQDQDDFDILI